MSKTPCKAQVIRKTDLTITFFKLFTTKLSFKKLSWFWANVAEIFGFYIIFLLLEVGLSQFSSDFPTLLGLFSNDCGSCLYASRAE